MPTLRRLEDGTSRFLEGSTSVRVSDGDLGPSNGELREDGGFELREDGGFELRED